MKNPIEVIFFRYSLSLSSLSKNHLATAESTPNVMNPTKKAAVAITVEATPYSSFVKFVQ